ncbi:MAG: MGMT family protein [Capsulimonadaceae bacterium]|nr:MGMT family protein [Capsulimonadaceae bacterium]
MNDKPPRPFDAIYEAVRAIPAGRVMSYGQVGVLAGETPRTVGWAMTSAPDGVPWHRVVGADGYLRIGRRSPDLQRLQRDLLAAEGIPLLENGCVDMELYQAEG